MSEPTCPDYPTRCDDCEPDARHAGCYRFVTECEDCPSRVSVPDESGMTHECCEDGCEDVP